MGENKPAQLWHELRLPVQTLPLSPWPKVPRSGQQYGEGGIWRLADRLSPRPCACLQAICLNTPVRRRCAMRQTNRFGAAAVAKKAASVISVRLFAVGGPSVDPADVLIAIAIIGAIFGGLSVKAASASFTGRRTTTT